jgi:hypothetical protein
MDWPHVKTRSDGEARLLAGRRGTEEVAHDYRPSGITPLFNPGIELTGQLVVE